jgi:serine/threonine protein kinase
VDGGESEAGVSGDIDMMSPSAKPKPRSRKSIGCAVAAKSTRRQSAGGSWAMGGMSMASSPDVSACIDSIDGASFRQLTPDDLVGLDERTFKGTIVGATYQQLFDDCPLVAPPGSSDARVVGVRMLHGGSDLELTVRRSRTRGAPQTVTLGDQWRWLRAEPDGYLVTTEAQLVPNRRCVLYWLPRHPVDWAQEETDGTDAGMHSPPPNASHHIATLHGHQGGKSFVAYEPSPSPSQRVVWTPGDVGLSGHAVMHPDMDEDGFSKGQASPIPIGMDFVANSAGPGDGLTMTVGLTSRPSLVPVGMSPAANVDNSTIGNGNGNAVGATMDWNNSSIAALVLEFLLGDEPVTATLAAPKDAKDAKGALTRRARRGGRRYEQATLEETISYRLVSKAWAVASYKLLAKHLSTLEDTDSTLVNYTKWSSFMRARPWGRFLSSGACKEVFCVQDQMGTRQAVSVMDVTDLRKRDMDAAVGRELEISMLCSALYSLNICPNTLCIHSLFRAEYGVAPKLWAPNRKLPVPHKSTGALPAPPSIPQKRTLTAGCHQFIRMELCCAGDLEEVVRREKHLLPRDIQILVFQMCFAMYACREQLQLRHHDVKLLNFFATDAAALRCGRALPRTTSPASGGDSSDNVLRIGFGAHIYALPLGSSDFSVAKLADFGTSVVGAGSLGDPIMLQHFTTLENTPPEFLLLGSRTRQAFSSDTFPLGLAVLHLLTGLEPYEELLGDVHCPAELSQALAQLWLHGEKSDDYHVIRRVVDTLELEPMYGEGEADTGGAVGAVLYDTLYRYLVLFEASRLDRPDPNSPVGRSRAWQLCSEILGFGIMNTTDGASSPDTARATVEATAAFGARGQDDADETPAVLQFNADRALWSLRTGTHAVIKGARESLEAVGPGMSRLLRKMCHFDPSRRCTMHEVLSNTAFASLREGNDNAFLSGGCGSLGRGIVEDVMAMDETSPMPVACLGDRFGCGSLGAGDDDDDDDGDGDISGEVNDESQAVDAAKRSAPLDFMHYFRPAVDGGSTCLPMV